MTYSERAQGSACELAGVALGFDGSVIFDYKHLFEESEDCLFRCECAIAIIKSCARDKSLECLQILILEALTYCIQTRPKWADVLVHNPNMLYGIVYSALMDSNAKKLVCMFLILVQIILRGSERGHAAALNALEQLRVSMKMKTKFTMIRKALSRISYHDSSAKNVADTALHFIAAISDKRHYHMQMVDVIKEISTSSVFDQIHKIFTSLNDVQGLQKSKNNATWFKNNRNLNVNVDPANAIHGAILLNSKIDKANTYTKRELIREIVKYASERIESKRITHTRSVGGSPLDELRLSSNLARSAICNNRMPAIPPAAVATYAPSDDLAAPPALGGRFKDPHYSGVPCISAEDRKTKEPSQNKGGVPPQPPPPPPKSDFKLFSTLGRYKDTKKGIPWATLEGKEVYGSIWDDSFLGENLAGNKECSLKMSEIEQRLYSNGTLKDTEKWFFKTPNHKSEVPETTKVADLQKRLGPGNISRKILGICVSARILLKRYNQDKIISIIKHGDVEDVDEEVIDQLSAVILGLNDDVKNEILSVKSGEKMFSDIELIRKIIEIPFVRRKIQALSITKKYHDEIIALKKDVYVLQDIIHIIKSSTFLDMMKVIFVLGNHINKVNNASTGAGIKLSTITKMSEFKSHSGEPFIELVANVFKSNYPHFLRHLFNADITIIIKKKDIVASVERGISSISKGLDLIEEEINWQKEALYNPTNKRSSRKLKKKLVDVHINMESSLQSTKKLYYKVVHNATSAAELYKEDPRSFGISEMTAVMVFLLKEFEKFAPRWSSKQNNHVTEIT